MKRPTLCFCWLYIVLACRFVSGASSDDASPEAVQAQIDAIKAVNVAWRNIDWETCLLDGVKQSRARQKPALL